MTAQTEVEKSLSKLQRLIRRPLSNRSERPTMTRRLPKELKGGELQQLSLLRDEVEAIEAVKAALLADLRFEHLRSPDDDVWQFVGECWVDRKTNQVPGFTEKHGREPIERVCFMPVEYLSVEEVTEVLGIRLLPTDDPRLPDLGSRFSLDKPIGCVAAVGIRGTSYRLMAERSQFIASHALRVMRVALREHRAVHDHQLRFRLGIAYAFDDKLSGWQTREEAAIELGFGGELITLAEDQPVSRMPAHPSTDIDKKADLALRWIERAWLTGDPLVALLYLFFALEAMLGDKSEKLKAHALAFRQTMLSHIVDGNFPHPNGIWFLYEKVRSGAVHGEDAPDIEWKVVHSFAWDVRRTLNQYLTVAEERHYERRARLLNFIDKHPHQPQLIEWLRELPGDIWTKFLNELGSEFC